MLLRAMDVVRIYLTRCCATIAWMVGGKIALRHIRDVMWRHFWSESGVLDSDHLAKSQALLKRRWLA